MAVDFRFVLHEGKTRICGPLDRTTSSSVLLFQDELKMSAAPDEMKYYGPRPGWQWIDFKELWRFRELIWMFALRDLKVRYRQTIVGVAWALIQPLVTMLVFGLLLKATNATAHSGDYPYALTCLCGLVPWQFFAASVTASTQSIVLNQQLVQKVYFPKVILPLSSMIPPLVDFVIAFSVILAMMVYYQVAPTIYILMLPLIIVLLMTAALALGLWLSALNAIYRDVQYVVPFLLQTGMFASPVIYEMSAAIPEKWQWLYSLNPMAGVLTSFRWAMLGTEPPNLTALLVSFAMLAIVTILGTFYFRRMERFFSDRV